MAEKMHLQNYRPQKILYTSIIINPIPMTDNGYSGYINPYWRNKNLKAITGSLGFTVAKNATELDHHHSVWEAFI